MSRCSPKFLAVVFVVLLFCAAAFVLHRKRTASPGPSNPTGLVSRELVDQFTALEAEENTMSRTVWAKEMLAEDCGHVFEALWDALNDATNKFEVLHSFEVRELIPGKFKPPQQLAHGIQRLEPDGAAPPWSEGQWRQFLEDSQ